MNGVSLRSLRQFVIQRKHALGLSFVLYVAVIWVAASFVVQDLASAGLNPFLLTYIANSLFVVLLPLSGVAAFRQDNGYKATTFDEATDKQIPQTAAQATVGLSADRSPYEMWVQAVGDRQLRHAALVVWQCKCTSESDFTLCSNLSLQSDMQVAPIWFAAQLTFNFSLSMTNVTSNTILSSTSSLFTFGLSCILLKETFTVVKLASIAGCIAGIAMVTFGDGRQRSGQQSLAGDMLCLLSSFFYAAYTVAIRKMLPADDQANVSVFFGFIGMLNFIGMAPFLLLLWLTSAVQLYGVTAWLVFLAVCKGLLDNVLSDYLWARAVLLIGPTLATVGLSVQVPLAVAADSTFSDPPWLHSLSSAAIMVCGAFVVLCGVLGVTLSTSQSQSESAQVHPGTSDDEMVLRHDINHI